jgi:hypothetical protein
MAWHSTGRSVEGRPMPDVEVRFVRSESIDKAEAK